MTEDDLPMTPANPELFELRRLEMLPHGWGVMADDWMAGIYAAILLRLALHFNLV